MFVDLQIQISFFFLKGPVKFRISRNKNITVLEGDCFPMKTERWPEHREGAFHPKWGNSLKTTCLESKSDQAVRETELTFIQFDLQPSFSNSLPVRQFTQRNSSIEREREMAVHPITRVIYNRPFFLAGGRPSVQLKGEAGWQTMAFTAFD